MKLFLFLLDSFFFLKLSAQCVSVELSIEWKKQLEFDFKELNALTLKPAFLKITYKNLCDSAIYFSKISESKGIFPPLSYGETSYHYNPNLIISNYPYKSHIITIGRLIVKRSGFRYRVYTHL